MRRRGGPKEAELPGIIGNHERGNAPKTLCLRCVFQMEDSEVFEATELV
jgi:hypothetical protein